MKRFVAACNRYGWKVIELSSDGQKGPATAQEEVAYWRLNLEKSIQQLFRTWIASLLRDRNGG